MFSSSVQRPITGRQVFWGLVGFFGVVFAVNGAMVWAALGTFDGLETADSYRAAKAFNATIAQGRRQTELGWTLTASPAPDHIDLSFRDRAGQPVDGLRITAVLWRQSHDGDDRILQFTPRGEGVYRAPLAAPAPGRWEVRLQTEAADGTPVVVRQPVVIGGARP